MTLTLLERDYILACKETLQNMSNHSHATLKYSSSPKVLMMILPKKLLTKTTSLALG